jgi:hypothetical protein
VVTDPFDVEDGGEGAGVYDNIEEGSERGGGVDTVKAGGRVRGDVGREGLVELKVVFKLGVEVVTRGLRAVDVSSSGDVNGVPQEP